MKNEKSPYQYDQKETPTRQTPTRGGQQDKTKRYPYDTPHKLNV